MVNRPLTACVYAVGLWEVSQRIRRLRHQLLCFLSNLQNLERIRMDLGELSPNGEATFVKLNEGVVMVTKYSMRALAEKGFAEKQFAVIADFLNELPSHERAEIRFFGLGDTIAMVYDWFCKIDFLVIAKNEKGRIVGVAPVFRDDAGLGAVGLGLLPDFRKKLVVEKMLETVVAKALDENFSRLEARVRESQTETISAYEEVGFCRSGNCNLVPDGNGGHEDQINLYFNTRTDEDNTFACD